MTLESIELEHVGPFRGKAEVGPLKPGINVLAAPNESGKSTFLRAAARALFDRHTCKDDEIQSLRPAGSDLVPRIAVIFTHGGARYRVEKRFLNSPESTFSEWRDGGWALLAEADAADERVQKLLQSTVPGRGATKAAHWGMLSFLWARQGEASEWPRWDGESGRAIQTSLARVEIDPVIEHLRESLWADCTELFTDGGKPKKHGALEQQEAELAKAEAELREVAAARAELGALERQFAEIGPRVEVLTREAASAEEAATALRALASAAEVTMADVQQRQAEFDVAREKLQTISADSEQLQKWRNELAAATGGIADAKAALAAAMEKETAATQAVSAAEDEAEAAGARVKALFGEGERTGILLKLKRAEAAHNDAQKQAGRAAKQAEIVNELRTQLAQIPNVTAARLKKLAEHHEIIRAHEAKLAAIGLTIELRPDADAKVAVKREREIETLALAADAVEVVRAAQSVELQLAGWGRLKIRSGAAELSTLSEELDTARTQLREQLAAAGCATLADAESAVTRRREADKDLKAAAEKLADVLGDFETIAALASHLASLGQQAVALRESLAPTSAEAAATAADLEADAERHRVALKTEQAAQTAAAQRVKTLRDAAAKASTARELADRTAAQLDAKAATLDQQIRTLLARHPSGLDDVRRDAQRIFVEAEARLAAAKARLPEDADKLPERNKRAAAACEQVRRDLEACRRETNRLEGALHTRGAAGLYSKESALLERIEILRQQVESLRTQGWAARLAHDLIQFRKQAATRSVLGPLEARLSDAFADITRDAGRRVFLDEHLQIAGIGAKREDIIAFEHLSQGAKEQLLLCLRLAVAAEVAGNGHRLVVLDDVLVNTDPARQQRVLDLLQSAPAALQILILTCHADRYRGVGERIEIRIG